RLPVSALCSAASGPSSSHLRPAEIVSRDFPLGKPGRGFSDPIPLASPARIPSSAAPGSLCHGSGGDAVGLSRFLPCGEQSFPRDSLDSVLAGREPFRGNLLYGSPDGRSHRDR